MRITHDARHDIVIVIFVAIAAGVALLYFLHRKSILKARKGIRRLRNPAVDR
jgi:hypothetical protein